MDVASPVIDEPSAVSAAAQEQIDKIARGASKKNMTPPTEEEIAEIEKAYKKKSFIPKEDVDEDGSLLKLKEARAKQTDAERMAEYEARVKAEQEAAADAGAGAPEEGIKDLYDLIGGGETGVNPIPDITGDFGGVATDIGQFGGEAAAVDEGIATAAKIAAAAKAGQTAVSEAASIANTFARAAEIAEVGEDAAVASTIITGLAGAQGLALAPVLTAAAEIALLTAVTYGAEQLFNEVSGKVERPDSLDTAAHELTQTERDYFQQFTDKNVHDAQVERGANVDATQLRRQPNSPFAAKGSGVTPGSGPGGQKTPLSVARDRDLYIEMSDAEKKVWDDNYNKTVANEKVALSYWNNLPEGTMIQNGVNGYEIVPPPTLPGDREPLPGTPQSWIDDFNNQLNNNGINKQQDGIGNQETMAQEEMAAAQSEKDAEMKEVYDYLAYMDQRNEAYLASIGQLEALPEAEPEPEAVSIVEADNGKRLKPVKTQSQAMPSSGKRYQSGKAQFPVEADNGKRLKPVNA